VINLLNLYRFEWHSSSLFQPGLNPLRTVHKTFHVAALPSVCTDTLLVASGCMESVAAC